MRTKNRVWFVLLLSIFLILNSFRAQSQQITPLRYDFLFFGGGDLSYVKNSFIKGKYARMDIIAGSEFFVFRNLSAGLSLDYNLNLVDFEKGLYTSLNLSLYTNSLYYLKGEYIHHYKYVEYWKYPSSFKEKGYAVGIGKKIFLNNYLILNLALNAQYFRASWIDAQEEICRREKIQITVTTGLLIYKEIKTKNYEIKN